MHRLAVVLVNYRTPELTLQALESLEAQLGPDDHVIVVDNASGDASADTLDAAIRTRGWTGWARLLRSDRNGGFSYGNNLGIREVDAAFYLLLNSDTLLRPDALRDLLAAAERHPTAGLIGPRLEWPDATPQNSAFRRISPVSEFLEAAKFGPFARLLRNWTIALGTPETPISCDWVSFACVLVRREVFDRVGGLDEGYFLYFEDLEFSRRAAAAGFGVVHDPQAHVVHLRGGSSSLKERTRRRERLQPFFYRSRARYFRTFYGRGGLWSANLLWTLGRCVSLVREILQRRPRAVPEKAWRDIWIGALTPFDALRAPRQDAP